MSVPPNPIAGVWRMARGRKDGMSRFGATPQSFLTSLAPLIAFPMAWALWTLLQEGVVPAVYLITVSLIAHLGPPVLSHAVAQWWGREGSWLHYATAYNWCYWAIPIVAVGLMILVRKSTELGLPLEAAAEMLILLLGAYSLWLHWFLARHGLGLGGWRAAGLVLLVNTGTLLLAFGPRFLA